MVAMSSLPREGVELQVPNGRWYRLLARLGGGKYSVVWKAEAVDEAGNLVAVKVMAPGLDEKARRLFIREAYTLLTIAQAEEALGLQLDEASLVPAVEAIADEYDPPFFVETLARGKPLDQILREEHRLSETAVLTIGEQLCRVFQALHEGEGLGRSYLDFQPRNVFWDAEAGRIMVVDWNLLSPAGQADVAGDLETIARLLYRLAVGQSFLASSLRYAEQEGWMSLTSGMRAILAQALHPNLARRYSSAATVRKDLQQRLVWWAQQPEALLRTAALRLEEIATRETTLQEQWQDERDYLAVEGILDIAERKEADQFVINQLRGRVAEGLSESSALGRGRAFFDASDYAFAAEAFAEARDEALTPQDRLMAHRWWLAAQAGREAGGKLTPHRDAIVQMIEMLSAWTRAEWIGQELDRQEVSTGHELTLITTQIGSHSLQRLADEAEAWTTLCQARLADMQNPASCLTAAEAYRRADQLARSLSDSFGEVLLYLWGDLSMEANKLEARAKALQKADARYEEVAQACERSTNEGKRALQKALKETPGNESLTALALKWSRQALEQGQPWEAKACLDSVILYVDPCYHGEMLTLQQQIDKHLEQQQRLDWVANTIRSLEEATDASRLATLDLEVLAKELAASRSADCITPPGEMTEATQKWLCQRLADAARDAAWGQVHEVLRAVAQQVPDAPLLRQGGWQLAMRAVQSPALPWSYRSLFLQSAEGLIPAGARAQILDEVREAWARRQMQQQIESLRRTAEDLAELGSPPNISAALQKLGQAIDLAQRLGDKGLVEVFGVQKSRYEEICWGMERKQLHEQIESHRQAARHLASLDLVSSYEAALEKLEQALALTEGLGDSGLVAALDAQKRECETACSVLEARDPREQMDAHYRQAKDFMDLGLLSKFPEALRELDEALSLARRLGDRAIIRTLEKMRKEYADRTEMSGRLFAGVEQQARKKSWSMAIRLVKQLKERYGVSGSDIPGEIDDWLTELDFNQNAAEFEVAYSLWKTATEGEKKLLLDRMGQTWQGMKALTERLDDEAHQRFDMLERQYAGCYYELHTD